MQFRQVSQPPGTNELKSTPTSIHTHHGPRPATCIYLDNEIQNKNCNDNKDCKFEQWTIATRYLPS